MSNIRRFLIASSFARLIAKERGVEARIVEGHFPGRFGRSHFVSFEPGHAFLVLTDPDMEGGAGEERTEVPPRHGEALLEVAQGRIIYDRSRLPLRQGAEAALLRYVEPPGLHVLTVAIEGEADSFEPPSWFGPEVTGSTEWQRHSIALANAPAVPEIAISNDALTDLLRVLESRAAVAASLQEWVKGAKDNRETERT